MRCGDRAGIPPGKWQIHKVRICKRTESGALLLILRHSVRTNGHRWKSQSRLLCRRSMAPAHGYAYSVRDDVHVGCAIDWL